MGSMGGPPTPLPKLPGKAGATVTLASATACSDTWQAIQCPVLSPRHGPICTSLLPPHRPPLQLLRSDVKPDPGLQSGPMAAKDLVVTVVAMLDKHLPASEVPMLAEAYMRMEEWFSSPHGAAQLEALRKANAATLLKCAGMSSTMIAWTLWKSIQRLLEQTPAQTPSFDADQNQDMAAVEPLCGAEAPPSPALQKAPGGLAGLGVDPLPHVQEWGTYRVGARCFEVVQKPIVKQLGLKKSEPGSRVPILVALVMEQTGQPHASGAVQDLGILNLPCLAKQARGPKHRPETTTYWSPDTNDTAFGAHHNCLLVRHTGLSTWNVPADDAVALKCVNHAIHSAHQEEAMATIMLIPGKKGISYPKHIDTLRRYPEYCQHLASIPPTKTRCPKPGKHAKLHIYVIWDAAGQQLVTKGNPQGWLASTATALHPQRDTHPIRNRPTNQSQPATPPSGHKQHMRLPLDRDLPTAGHQCSHEQLTHHSTTQPRMAITEWATIAYTDGSCIKTSGAAPASVGAGVYIPENNFLITAALNDPESNTINKAELTAIHAALKAGAKRIATDSLCSLYQIRRALANPMSLITHRHNDILAAIATLIIDSPVTIQFLKVRAHSGIIGNEGADVLAKHAALHPELANTPAYSPTTRKETKNWLSNATDGESPAPLPDCRQSVRAHIHRKHKLGLANQDNIYYQMSQEITKVAATGAGERVMVDTNISTHAQRTALLYRTGGLYNQKLAMRWKRATDDRCPLCGEADSATHLLSGCSETLPMVQERHNGAGRLITKAISKGTLGGYISFADTGSWEKGAKESLDLPSDTLHTTLQTLGLKPEDIKHTTRPDILMVLPHKKASKDGKDTKRGRGRGSNRGRGRGRRRGQRRGAAGREGAAAGAGRERCQPGARAGERGRGRGPARGRERGRWRCREAAGARPWAWRGATGRGGAGRGAGRGRSGAARALAQAWAWGRGRGRGPGTRAGGGRSASLRTGARPRPDARPEPAARQAARRGGTQRGGGGPGRKPGRGPGARARGAGRGLGAQPRRGRGGGRERGHERGWGRGRFRGARQSGAGRAASLGASRRSAAGRGGAGPGARPGARSGARPGARPKARPGERLGARRVYRRSQRRGAAKRGGLGRKPGRGPRRGSGRGPGARAAEEAGNAAGCEAGGEAWASGAVGDAAGGGARPGGSARPGGHNGAAGGAKGGEAGAGGAVNGGEGRGGPGRKPGRGPRRGPGRGPGRKPGREDEAAGAGRGRGPKRGRERYRWRCREALLGAAGGAVESGESGRKRSKAGKAVERDLIHLAKEASDQLLGSSNAVPKALQILNSIGKRYFLHVSDQAAVGVGCGLDRAAEEEVTEKWKLIWKEPKWPWSSLMQHWEEVKWTATSPQGQWVLGLKAAGNARPATVTHDLAAMQEELVGHSAMPGIQSVSTQWRDATVMATARPEAQPQPHIDSWTQLKGFTDRSLEYLPKPLALQFGLHECGADKVELLVVLAHQSGSTGADHGPGCLQLPYEATRRPDGRWSLKARSPQSVKISTWVKNCGLALTGRCKAQRAEPGQAVEQLLVLEVRPLSEAAASAGQATPGQSGWPRGTAQGPGALPPAPGAEAQPPELQAELPGKISGTTSADVATAGVDEEEGSQPPQPIAAGIPSGSMTSADAATASNAAAAAVALEEEGPHPSHPVATGTPSGGSALRARLAGSGREDAIDLTFEEPDVKPDPGLQSGPMAAKDLVVTVVAMLDKHLPASEVPMLADAYTCMGEWLSSPHGAAQLEALSKVYAATLLKCAGMSSTMVAWTLWKSIQRLLEQTPAQAPSFDAVSGEAALSPAATFDLNHTGSSAQAAAAARQSKSTASELEGPEGPAKRHRGLVPRKLCMGGGEADTASDQGQEAAAQEVVGAEELPPAALTGLPTTRGNLGKRDDRYHGNHGALLPRQASAQQGTSQLQALVSSRVIAGLTRCMVWLLQGLDDGPASASPTPLAGQAASPGRQATTRSGPMNCAQHPVQQPLRTACPISSPGLLAAPLLMPNCVREVLNKAQQLQDLLLVSRGAANDLAMQHNVDATLLRDLDPDFLPFLSQSARPPNWNIRREGQQVVMVCVPSNGMPTLQRPPPPFLVSCLGNSVWELVWKAPDWPWGSVQQHWGKVEWVAKGPHQELVLGLQAAIRPGHAADNSSTPSSSVVHAAFSTPQQQGPGSQGATMVGRMEAAASKGPPSLALPHAPPCGSEPLPGQHAGNGVKGAAGRSLTASLGGPAPSAVMSPSQASVEGAALLAVPGTHGTGNTASPHSQPATPASQYSVPEEDPVRLRIQYRCPGTQFRCGAEEDPDAAAEEDPDADESTHLMKPFSEWDFALKPMSDVGSLYLLNLIAQPTPPGDWEEQAMDFVFPVVCVTHDGLCSPHQLPPPFLMRSMRDHQLTV
ncbi:hypothetical protein QJQ45_021245, partial [Haematococcus lacustris]